VIRSHFVKIIYNRQTASAWKAEASKAPYLYIKKKTNETVGSSPA